MPSSIRSSSRRGYAAIATLLSVLLVSTPVLAAEAARQATGSPRARARSLFLKAQKAYDLGRFEEAAKLYGDAYELAPLPGFLFNIAQCERLRGRPAEAAFFYRRFLEKAPHARNAELARELLTQVQNQAEQIRRLRLEVEAKPRSDFPAGRSVASPDADERTILESWWLWTGVGLVAGAAGGATVMYLIQR